MSSQERTLFMRLANHRWSYVMLLPGVLWFVIYRYIPIIGNIMAFKEFKLLKGIVGSPWASPWYKFFRQFFISPYFLQLLRNTLIISVGKMVFSVVPSIVLAILLSECPWRRYAKTVQTITYMPHFLSWVIVYAIFYAMFSQNGGFLNTPISGLAGRKVEILSDPGWFRWVLLVSESWQSSGWGAIIFLAAITTIDPSLYEAARIDGASRLQSICHITLPSISVVIIFVVLMRAGRVLDAGFEHVFVFYNPLVYSTGDIFDTWVFRVGLEQRAYSLGAAVGLFKSIIGFVLIISTNRLARSFGRSLW